MCSLGSGQEHIAGQVLYNPQETPDVIGSTTLVESTQQRVQEMLFQPQERRTENRNLCD